MGDPEKHRPGAWEMGAAQKQQSVVNLMRVLLATKPKLAWNAVCH